LIFQDCDLGEAFSAEAQLRPTEGKGNAPSEAKCSGKWGIDETDETDQIDQTDQIHQTDGIDGTDQIDRTDGTEQIDQID
jgi:hypothetical protein